MTDPLIVLEKGAFVYGRLLWKEFTKRVAIHVVF